jgi:hypothetical protein
VSFKHTCILLLTLAACSSTAQSFDLRSEYTFDAKFTDTTGKYNALDNSIGVTFPIKRTFKTEVDLDLSSLKLKDIIKKSVRLRASEILGTVKLSNKQVTLGFDSTQRRSIHQANLGVLGLHLTKKYRILFYSANAFIQEQDKTLGNAAPRFSAMLGQYHIRGLRKSFYYGAAVVYSDGLLLPAPFIGGTEPINKYFSFNYTLPVQLNLQFHDQKTFAILGVKADGYRAGMLIKNKRTNLNVSQVKAYLNFRYRFSNTFQVQAEGGYIVYQQLRLDKTNDYNYKYPLNGSPYANVSLNVYFGKSILEKIVEQVF